MTVRRILTVSESDSGGGAGIQADIKTIMAFGGYASSAITSVTAQNSRGVQEYMSIEPSFVALQMRAVLDDIGADAIKIGLLGGTQMINDVSDVLDDLLEKDIKIVVDPSMVERDGSVMIDQETIATLKRRLLVRATVLTPNLREAELLTGMKIHDIDDMKHAADMIRTLGADAVVLKGGQISGEKVVDLVATNDGETIFESPILRTRHTQGAGATLSTAIAICIAEGMDTVSAVRRSLDYLNRAIETAYGFGQGAGPINHGHPIERSRFIAA